jgi:hypothetical protein
LQVERASLAHRKRIAAVLTNGPCQRKKLACDKFQPKQKEYGKQAS